jgi:SAM-dependent methyltransferase
MTHTADHLPVQGHVQETQASLAAWAQRRKTSAGFPIARPEIAQMASRVVALYRAISEMHQRGLDVTSARVLDVGSSAGVGLIPFLWNGFRLEQMHGIDMNAARVAGAQRTLPGVQIVEGDATDMRAHYADASFDLVCEQFCFCHIPSADVRKRIAAEMLRIVKPGGFLLVHDWRMTAGRRQIFGVPQSLIRELFGVGTKTTVVTKFASQLWPPVGRSLSRYTPHLYSLGLLVPPLVGSRLTVLQRLPAA